MLSLIEAQAQFFQYGHKSLSELEDFKRSLGEEVSGQRLKVLQWHYI